MSFTKKTPSVINYITFISSSCRVKINPHVLPPQTAWQRQQLHTSWLCSAEPLFTFIEFRQKPTKTCKTRFVHTAIRGRTLTHPAASFAIFFKAGFDSRRATPCRLRPRWSLPDHFTAAGGPKRRASSLKNKSRPSTTVLKSEFSIRGNTLPALMSRSSWFACPSCCEVAMFPPLAADSHWLLTVWITPQQRQNLNETNHARMYKSLRERHRKFSFRPPSAA